MADDTEEKVGDRVGKRATSADTSRVRRLLAQLLWIVCVAFASLLAVGALTYALDANADNALVEFVREWAHRVDLGIFSLDNGIKQFDPPNAETKDALFNWGLGAVFWLIVGRLLDRIVRP